MLVFGGVNSFKFPPHLGELLEIPIDTREQKLKPNLMGKEQSEHTEK